MQKQHSIKTTDFFRIATSILSLALPCYQRLTSHLKVIEKLLNQGTLPDKKKQLSASSFTAFEQCFQD